MIGQELVNVEEETMQPILQYCPDKVTQEEARQSFNKRFRRRQGQDKERK